MDRAPPRVSRRLSIKISSSPYFSVSHVFVQSPFQIIHSQSDDDCDPKVIVERPSCHSCTLLHEFFDPEGVLLHVPGSFGLAGVDSGVKDRPFGLGGPGFVPQGFESVSSGRVVNKRRWVVCGVGRQLGVQCRREGLDLVGSSSKCQVEVFRDEFVMGSRPRDQLITSPVADAPRARKEVCFPLPVHVPIFLIHDGFRDALEAFSSCVSFPMSLHAPREALHGVAESRLQVGDDLDGVRLLLRKHLRNRLEHSTWSGHRE